MIHRHGRFCARSLHILCGHCHDYHHSVAQVQVCGTSRYTDPQTGHTHAPAWPCSWLMEFADGESGWAVRECGHPAFHTERGHTCAAGHEHVCEEVRHAEGWDYADDDEAAALAAAGITPVGMDGRVHIFT